MLAALNDQLCSPETPEAPSLIIANSRGEVFSIVLQPNLVNYLFRASDLSGEDFMNAFADAYKLGKPTVDNLTSRSYTTAQGVKITIDSDKSVSLKKVVAPADVKRAFD